MCSNLHSIYTQLILAQCGNSYMVALQELKKAVISCVLKTLVNCVIVPATGGSGRSPYKVDAGDISWSTEFRNATGVLRFEFIFCGFSWSFISQ